VLYKLNLLLEETGFHEGFYLRSSSCITQRLHIFHCISTNFV